MTGFRLSDISFSGVLVGFYLFSVPAFSYSLELGLSQLPQVVGGVLVLYAVAFAFQRGYLMKNTAVLLYLLFTVWCFISSQFTVIFVPPVLLMTLLKVAVISASVGILINTKTDLVQCLLVYFASIFIIVYLNHDDILALRGMTESDDTERFAGTLQNANTAALYAISIIWSGIVLIMSKKQGLLMKIFVATGMILGFVLVIYSGSRKGMLGIAILTLSSSYLMFRFYGKSVLAKAVLALLAFVGIIGMAYFLYTSPFFDRMESTISEGKYDTRVYLFREAINVWNSSPRNFLIGIGLGNFIFYNTWNLYSHSTLSETLVSTGLIGFIIYFSSIFSVIWLYLKVYRKKSGVNRIIAQLMMVFLLLILLFNTFAVMITNRLFWPMISLIFAYGITLKNEDPDPVTNTV